MISETVSCNLCGHKYYKVMENDETPFRVVKCKKCSLVFVHPYPNYEKLKRHYADNYYEEWLAAQRKKRIKMWNRRLKRLENCRERGSILDVGCGEGTFLQVAKKNDWTINGTELSAYGAKYATNLLGVEIFCGELYDAKFPENSFDVITMWHVLEHVTDPKGYLTEIKRILKPDGLLIIAVPNVNDLLMRIAYRIVKRRRIKLFLRGEKEVHLYHFSPKTIKAYLDTTGFECMRLRPDFGIVENSKKLINLISTLPYFLAGIKIFNAIEVYAIFTKDS
jgi:2-polyprenyl-3-methyl-5-hydroxy-6-metoxy-1,4-benzoquinol methylase